MREYTCGMRTADGKKDRKRDYGKYAVAIFAIAIIFSLILGAISLSLVPSTPAPKRTYISYAPETVDSFGDVGQYSSLALNGSDEILIIYYNATAGDFNIASYSPGDGWDTMTPYPTPENDGLYCSIDVNSSGIGMGSCYDATNGYLMYGNGIGEYYAVDTGGDVGMYSSIDVQPATDSIAISYYNASSGDLKVAYNKSGNTPWVIYTVDSTNDVGQYSDMLFMTMNDSMSVTYYDITNGDLRNAWAWDLGAGLGPWDSMPIDETGDTGKWSSQAGTSDGSWYGSWYVADTQNLRTGYWNTTTWVYNQFDPDTIGDVGQYTSIGYNSSGNTVISYYDATNGDLKLAWNESNQWFNMTLDSTGDVGKFTSLRIDSSDAIHISYYDATNGDLKYVKVLPEETPIPEFGEILIPVVGMIAIAAMFSIRRNRRLERTR